MGETRFVSLPVPECVKRIDEAIVDGSITGERLDRYALTEGGKHYCTAMYEKYYYRAGNRLTLTVTADDLTGKTRLHWISAGGGNNVFWRFDWGAAESFDGVVRAAMEPYFIE